MKSNEKDIPATRKKAKQLGSDIFTVKTVNPRHSFTFQDDAAILPRKLKYRRYVYQKGTYERVKRDSPPFCPSLWSRGFIHSNGSVVACGRDYAEEMKIGNVLEKPFSQMWNGPEFKEWRRQYYYERESLPLCNACDINFKYTEGGEFPEVIDFNLGLRQRTWRRIKKMAPRRVKEIVKTFLARLKLRTLS